MSSRASEAPAPSLRRRLLVLVLAAITVVSAFQAASAYRTALRSADALFDQQLQQFARSIEAGVPLVAGDLRLYEFLVQVWGPDGLQIYRSHARRLPAASIIGFSDATLDGVRYRIYLLKTGDRTIQVAQDLDARRARARGLALDAMLPVALLAPVLMLAVWLIVRLSFAPLERMRLQVARREAEDLSPLPEPGVPREILPLVRELNLLFDRVDAAFASQRHFVADAAHELRSPLAALKLQVQALRGLPPGPQQDDRIARLHEGLERAIRLLSQLLLLARMESDAPGDSPRERVDLQAVCREAIADVLPQAHAARLDVGLETPAVEARVRGEPESLRILLRNLLENAVKFAPAGGRVDVALAADARGSTLRVEDSGPGIPEEERRRVFDRFYRGADGLDGPGSGLGLAIVQAIARRHGASVRLDTSQRLGGLAVEVVFPPGTGGLSEA